MFVKTYFLRCHPADESPQYLYIKGHSLDFPDKFIEMVKYYDRTKKRNSVLS